MRAILATLLLAASTASASAETVQSANDFATTLQKLREAIEASPASVIHEIDHAAGATSAGMELAPTTLVIFGNPVAGTPLMQADPTVGLALPMKVLVLERDGMVELVYDDPAMLPERYDLGDAAVVTEKMSGLVTGLVDAAAN